VGEGKMKLAWENNEGGKDVGGKDVLQQSLNWTG